MKLDFYTKRSQLDEMQEQKLCKLESRGFWLLWWGHLAVIFIQNLMGTPASELIWEWALFMLVSLYMLVECIRNGIWDRHIKPTLSANLVGSAIAGLVVFVYRFFVSSYWPGALYTGVFTALLCFAALQGTALLYKKRNSQLENTEEDKDEQQN